MGHIAHISGVFAGIIKKCQGRAECHIIDGVQTGIIDFSNAVVAIASGISTAISAIGREVGCSAICRIILPGGGITHGAASHVLDHQPGRKQEGCINNQKDQDQEKG